MKEIILKLFDIGAIQLGNFTLKSGLSSPIYIDLRRTISFPQLIKAIAELMWRKKTQAPIDCICGVPYTAIPLASYLSTQYHLPMVLKRKEAKCYGTKKMIEGVFAPRQRCLLLEDLITSGSSIFETITPLEEEGLKVPEIIVFLDREQGGKQKVEDQGRQLHAVITLSESLDILLTAQLIDHSQYQSVMEYIHAVQ